MKLLILVLQFATLTNGLYSYFIRMLTVIMKDGMLGHFKILDF